MRCPWGGLPCNCESFPWLQNGLIPMKCENQMPLALLGLRKVSDKGKRRYEAYLLTLERNRKNGGIRVVEETDD